MMRFRFHSPVVSAEGTERGLPGRSIEEEGGGLEIKKVGEKEGSEGGFGRRNGGGGGVC